MYQSHGWWSVQVIATQHTRRWTNAGLTLGQRLQRWANVKQHWFNFPFLKYQLTWMYNLLLRAHT